MHVRRWVSSAAFLILGLCPLLAQSTPGATLTVTVTGTLGPVLSGQDVLGLSGHTVVLTIAASESLTPVRQQGSAAGYQVPAGAVSVTIDGFETFPTTTPSKVAAVLTPSADIGELSATVGSFPPFTALVIGTIYLESGSWKHAVLKHPTAFSPSPQNITAATSATGLGSRF